MRTLNAAAAFGIIALAMAANSAEARTRVGISIGIPGPWYPYPSYYYPPPYYYPPTVVVPAAPSTYVQQAAPVQESTESNWYYCEDAKAYYPYVKQCPGGWTQVSPTPPNPR